MKFQTHIEAEIHIVMSQMFGSISATRAQLQRAFGVPIPHQADDYVTTEWHLIFEDGTIATVYDYRNPTGKPRPDEVLSWRIGGYEHRAVERVHQAFRVSNTERINEALWLKAQRLKEQNKCPKSLSGEFAE